MKYSYYVFEYLSFLSRRSDKIGKKMSAIFMFLRSSKIKTISYYFFQIYPINSSDIKVIAKKLLPGDMDKKFLDHNAIITFCGGTSSMELEQSGQNICVTVKGVLSLHVISSQTTTRTDLRHSTPLPSELMINE